MSEAITKPYRTLVRGMLVQDSALLAGGTPIDAGGPDLQAARDGAGRLTIPGAALAGCLIDTAARVFPHLFDSSRRPKKYEDERRGPWHAVSGKTFAASGSAAGSALFESLWRFRHAHALVPPGARSPIELRQGVGIRQATGATAIEAGALFDAEVVPAGTRWPFFLEVDTFRGGTELEAVALLALHEWIAGRCWLGAAAARGWGWMTLHDWSVLRLPCTREAVDLWPNNGLDPHCNGHWEKLTAVTPESNRILGDAAALHQRATSAKAVPARGNRARVVVFDFSVTAGPTDDGWGWDAVSVGGHAAAEAQPFGAQQIPVPEGAQRDEYHNAYNTDKSIVTTGHGAAERPFIPGSGLRGPLRHAASRLERSFPIEGATAAVADPNTRENEHPPRYLDSAERERIQGGGKAGETTQDPVAQLFGLVNRDSPLLVSDAALAGDCKLIWTQHHAEDEFTAGVYGHGKFDRTAVLQGTFRFQLVLAGRVGVNGPTDDESFRSDLRQLLRVLRLAQLGFVPLGGGKWRGLGWLPWKIEAVRHGRFGDAALIESSPEKLLEEIKPSNDDAENQS